MAAGCFSRGGDLSHKTKTDGDLNVSDLGPSPQVADRAPRLQSRSKSPIAFQVADRDTSLRSRYKSPPQGSRSQVPFPANWERSSSRRDVSTTPTSERSTTSEVSTTCSENCSASRAVDPKNCVAESRAPCGAENVSVNPMSFSQRCIGTVG